MKGIGAILRSGFLTLDPERQRYVISSGGIVLHCGNYSDLDPHAWGSLYEKYCGQKFAADGYEVDYRGLTAGFNDGGIDLILRKDDNTIFVQCKHTFKSSLSRNTIEKILYKAGNYISRHMPENRAFLWLVVPEADRIKWQRFFLRHNATQNRVKLELIEIPMLTNRKLRA